jgi:hypothetical protein
LRVFMVILPMLWRAVRRVMRPRDLVCLDGKSTGGRPG